MTSTSNKKRKTIDLDDDEKPSSATESILQSIINRITHPTKPVADIAKKWRYDTDFNNNFGADFIDCTRHPEYQKLIQLVHSSPIHMQSGNGAELHSYSDLLIIELQKVCEILFHHEYSPISIATHASELILQIMAAETADAAANGVDGKVVFLVLPNSYFHMQFTELTRSLVTNGIIHLINSDPSFPIQGNKSYDYDESKQLLVTNHGNIIDQTTLDDIESTIKSFQSPSSSTSLRRKCIMILEPFLIPGGGLVYTNYFVSGLQALCEKYQVKIVCDETLSFVRSGYPLFSRGYYNPPINADYVMIGKSIGCGLLLINSLSNVKFIQQEMKIAFTIYGSPGQLVTSVCSLALMVEQNTARNCLIEGEKIKYYLHTELEIPSDKIRGIGNCIWVDDGANLVLIPGKKTINGRLLLRTDQTVELLKNIFHTEFQTMVTIKQLDESKRHLEHPCAVCGESIDESLEEFINKYPEHTSLAQEWIDEDGVVLKFVNCTVCERAYHLSCILFEDDPLDINTFELNCRISSKTDQPVRSNWHNCPQI